MFSYVYMKILESRPARYDRGIALLSLGGASRCQRRLVEENVQPGFEVLEIGCGTGTLAILAARRRAAVLAFDVSAAMLGIARRKVAAAGVSDRVRLEQMGISGMEGLGDGRFDLVMSSLVLSELAPDERRYVLLHTHRLLKPGGRLAVADEVTPPSLAGRLVHAALRVPLRILTYLLTQTTTRPVDGLPEQVRQAGFRVESARRSRLDGLLCLVAAREDDP